MNKKQIHNKLECVVIILTIFFSNSFANNSDSNLLFTTYGGLGNIISSDTVTPKVFRSFQAWDSYIESNMLADTRTLPEMGDFPYWKNDSFYFENSIAIAFAGNRIATILDVFFSEDKIIVKYKLSTNEFTITDYQFNPQGQEFEATAIVFYFLSSETMDLKEKEVVFLIDKVSVKKPEPVKIVHLDQNDALVTKKVDMSGRSISKSKTSGIYIIKSDRHTLSKIEIK